MKLNDAVIGQILQFTRNESARVAVRESKRMHSLVRCAQLLDIARECDVETQWEPEILVSYEENVDAFVRISLDASCPADFIRRFVRALGVPLARKSRHYADTSLNVDFRWQGIDVRVLGYVPATCRVEYEDVVIPAQPERVEKRARIVCVPELTDDVSEASEAL